ncbi:MAG: hypothetical protein HQL64_08755 [Magnetococcales bacterium]|nr:hypothetical protein [Magnetococcales bacterium]
MEIRWSKAAHGFHQATYPNKKYRLFVTLVQEIVVGGKTEERLIPLGRVDVEETIDGSLNFLFGSQIAFWPGVHKKLQEIEASPEEVEKIVASIATRIPPPPKDQPRPLIIRGSRVSSLLLFLALFLAGNVGAEQKVWFVQPVALPASRLESIRLATDRKCGPEQVLVEEFFSVATYDLAELLMVRESEVGRITRQPVQWADANGRIVHAYCAERTLDTSVKTWFLRYDGHATPPLGYRIQLKERTVEGPATPLLPVHRKTRYQQFVVKEHPENGTCCWHYLYAYYSPPTDETMTSLSIPLTFKEAPPAGSYIYFQFHAAINGTKFYFGLQTDLFKKGQVQGPGVIFSRWDTQDSADFQVVPEGYAEIGAHEGRFVGVRRVVAWGTGQWTLNLAVRDQKEVQDPEHVWLDMTLGYNDEKKTPPLAVGSLRFPGRAARLTKDITVVAESYAFNSGLRANVWQLPKFDLVVQTPLFNGKPLVKPPRITYPADTPRVVEAVVQNGGIRIHREGLLP